MQMHIENQWSTDQASALYGLDRWGSPYFSISEKGEVCVDMGSRSLSLYEAVEGMVDRGIALPVMVRFSHILDERISAINRHFAEVIERAGYQNHYRGVFPIKVNQQQQVVEEVARFGAQYHHGLEAGSKPELLAALAYIQDPEAYIICNGYKDAEFIDLALYACKMGQKVILVVEMLSEVTLISERAKLLKIKPIIGLRMKLSTPGSGHWIESAGDQSVFGLTASQLIAAVDALRSFDMLDCLQMLHYHLGSQIPSINTIRQGANEASRVYAGLVREGAPMGILDVGGGLAVDYDGMHTGSDASCNYGLAEYCADVVEVVMTICDEENVSHPVLVSESGRATVAPYGVLLFNILEVAERMTHSVAELPTEGVHRYTLNLKEMVGTITPENFRESLNDAVFYRDEVRKLFDYGSLELRERALAEHCFNHTMVHILKLCHELDETTEEFVDLPRSMADIYYGNFSLFQSMPDAWAIDQIFPVMPVHRLLEKPDREAVIADITCDCDGKIDRFVIDGETVRTLPLHRLHPDHPYVIGVFLVGAYQETLGDLHNLFGDTNVVSIGVDEDGEIEWSHAVKGDTASDVLSYVEFEPKKMIMNFQSAAEKAVKKGLLTPAERRRVVEAYEHGMSGYTYFEEE
ncbi:MAG: arginine decarboxylase [Kiritimatiellia bacterium]|jgi:arginine decarboxylase